MLAAMGFFDEAEACISMQLLVGEEHGFSNIADRSIAAFRARHLLAELLLERGQVAAAEENAREVIRVRPTYGQAWVSLAEALAMQGKSSELTSLRGHVEEAFRSETAVVLLRAWERASGGDESGALAALDEALVGHREDLFLLKARALLMFRRGVRGDDLRNDVEGILRVDPICPRMRAIQRYLNASSVPSWLPRTPADMGLRPVVL